MTDYSEPYWCEEHDPPVKCYDYCEICAEDDLFNWGEQDWADNRLMYENELEYLEELPKREKK